MLKTIKKLIPYRLKKIIWCLRSHEANHSGHLRTSTTFSDIGEAGSLIKNIFEPLKEVPGWFNVDDCSHFHLILSLQSLWNLKGDLLEIGSYHGRSTSMMASYLAPDEKIVICDAFESDTDDQYQNKPSPEKLIASIFRINKGLKKRQIVIHQCLSNDLSLDEDEQFRFIHIDGGHSAEQAYCDLMLCKNHLLPNGIMAMDDYHNEMWPGVTEGTDRFLQYNDDIRVLADLNRHGALGRKLYLIKAI